MNYFCMSSGNTPKEYLSAAKCNIKLYLDSQNLATKKEYNKNLYLLKVAIGLIEDTIKNIDDK